MNPSSPDDPNSTSNFAPAKPAPSTNPLGGDLNSPLAMEHPGLPATSGMPQSDGGNSMEGTLRRAASAVGGQASRLASEIRERSHKVADEATQMAGKMKHEAAHMANEVKGCVQRHPLASALTTIGLGVAIGFAVHQLLKPRATPRQRAMSLLSDIRESMAELASTSAEYAKDATRHGSKAMKRGMDAMSDSRAANQLRHLFS
jgi:ElaB/YqjD/DUF883 family membrane-anchored ribosome-binding protein